jgi:hypothetical protein
MKRMIDAYKQGDQSMKPDVFSFTVLIKACGNTRGTPADERRALTIAFEAMKALETSEFGSPNQVTFWALLGAVDQLALKSEMVHLLGAVFERCATGGHVSKQILELPFIQKLPSIRSMKALDHAWIRNVPKRDRPRLDRYS